MIVVKEVKTKKEQKQFLNFPLKLYKDNPYFAPPLYIDEKKIFNKDYCYYDTCEAVYFNAYENDKIVGRISGILQKAANEKNGEKKIRFTRIDAIDSFEVFEALFNAVENWGREKGMTEIVGPLGFSDLEREGLLIEGFDQMSTFEEQYSADYYPGHIEKLGYKKDVDWVESYVRAPKEIDPMLDKTSEFVIKRYNLHWFKAKNVNDFLKKYANKFFDILDESYDQIYGTVPFTDNMKKMMIDNFRLIIKLKYVGLLLDENDNPVAFGVCFPALGKALQKSSGRLTPAALLRVLKACNKTEVIDFGLVGVANGYLEKGVVACIMSRLIKMMKDDNIEHAETNLNLEDNLNIRNIWKRFDSYEHKKRRCYIKSLEK